MARPGLGYVLKPGFMLPPLMFSEEEIEALVLGSRWVAKRSDAQLGAAARNALAKIVAVLPADLRDDADNSPLLVAPGQMISIGENELPTIRRAIRAERKIAIDYRDDKGRDSQAHGLAVRAGLFRPRARRREPGASCAVTSAISASIASSR